MEFLIYALIFIMGTFFGSFFTLAVYRIPLGLNILYEHSFCPNCNHKLKSKDLIPVLSYLILGGKCRNCGKKIRIRYLFLELLSGFVFMIFAISFKVDIFNLSVQTIIHFTFFILYFACLFIIAGIDYEKNAIQKSVLVFGICIAICFMVYVCIAKKAVIYTYIIVLAGIAFLLIADTVFLKKKLTENYTIGILILSLLMIIFSGAEVFYFTVALSLLLISSKLCIDKIKDNSKKKSVISTVNKELNIPLGFFLSVSNILLIIVSNFLR